MFREYHKKKQEKKNAPQVSQKNFQIKFFIKNRRVAIIACLQVAVSSKTNNNYFVSLVEVSDYVSTV